MRNSLYDDTASTTPGSDNVIGVPFSAVFADPAASDFHLQPTSPAREAAEAQTNIADDLDHNPRPMPEGSVPDLGAYEVP